MNSIKMLNKSQISFWNKTHCDRCEKSLKGEGRMMSWFNDDCLCMECIESESWIKRQLHKKGHNPDAYEGCGEVPEVWKDEKLCHSGARDRCKKGRVGQHKKGHGGQRDE